MTECRGLQGIKHLAHGEQKHVGDTTRMNWVVAGLQGAQGLPQHSQSKDQRREAAWPVGGKFRQPLGREGPFDPRAL